jgi:hypothetical protein
MMGPPPVLEEALEEAPLRVELRRDDFEELRRVVRLPQRPEPQSALQCHRRLLRHGLPWSVIVAQGRPLLKIVS